MEITQNTFIDILGLPEWDDRVIAVLEQLELERPILKKDEVDKFLNSEKYGIELFFDQSVTTDLQKELESTGTIFLDHVLFEKNTTLPMLYNIVMGDNYETIVSKIGSEAYYKDIPMAENKASWFLGDDSHPYRLALEFNNQNLEVLNTLWIRVEYP